MKIKRYLLTLVFIGMAISCFAQTADSILITGRFEGNTKYVRAVLYRFGAGEAPILNTEIKEERFHMTVPLSLPAGVYRLRYSQNDPDAAIDLIITGERRIDFRLDIGKSHAIPVFDTSEQNRAWYDYQSLASRQTEKITVLGGFIGSYPGEKDAVVREAYKALEKEKQVLQSAYDRFGRQYAGTWAGNMVKNRPQWFPNPKDHPKLQAFYYREQYWKGINTSDTTLLNSPLYTEHMLNYLRYYMNSGIHFSEEEQKKGFKESVDTIVQRFSANATLRKFSINYLTQGFKEIGQEEVLQYIDEKYSEKGQCSDEQGDAELKQRLAAYAALKPGMPAPAITFADRQNTEAGLKDLRADTVIVAFWASWCPHCAAAMPKVDTAMAGHPGIQLLAVSLDEDPKAYREAAGKLGNMLHLCDYRKWQSQPVEDYHIVATPTFFMLDKDRKIIGKYTSADALISGLTPYNQNR
jgi:thiol-disulfide isomerase/thioredoxin